MRSDLRPHQEKALLRLRQSLAGGKRRPMVAAPTGAGKTILAAAVVDGARAKGNRVVFVVPALSLIDQTVEAFWREGIHEVGVIQADHELTDWSKPVQVASVQTLQRRKLPEAHVVVIDEAHKWFEFYGRWMGDPDWQKVPFIGLSATPWAKGLGKHYDDLIIASTTKELIEQGYLSKFRVFAPSHPDLTGVRTVAGDYHEGDLEDAMDKAPLVADVVETWLQLGEGRPTLCFGVNRAHAKHLQERFADAGVSVGYVDAFTDGKDRKAIRDAFQRGDLQVVCSVGCLTTGVDWDVRCIILARPTKSEMLYVQIIGRGLRTAEGKDDLLVLDHSDTTLRLGFVTDVHRGTLDDGQPKKGEGSEDVRPVPLPKECPQCTHLKPPRISVCPVCGFKTEKQSEIEVEDGELVEITSKTAARNNRAMTWDDKISFIRQLRAFAAEKGRTDGWVAHAYRDKFGVFPNDPRVKYVGPAAAVSAEVRSWIKAKDIRFAKARQKARAA